VPFHCGRRIKFDSVYLFTAQQGASGSVATTDTTVSLMQKFRYKKIGLDAPKTQRAILNSLMRAVVKSAPKESHDVDSA
jgi:hypothetical protein